MTNRSKAWVRVRVWDAPTRVAHWALVTFVAAAWWTAENGWLEWHRYNGYALLGVLAFRVYWGFLGSATARFAGFIAGPRAVWSHVRLLSARTDSTAHLGHNPLGGWSVLTLLALLIGQVALGLFAVDIDGIESGPLAHLVSFDAGRVSAWLHRESFDVLLAFLALHLSAVAFYFIYKKQNLVSPMISGERDVEIGRRVNLWFAPRGRWIVGVALAAALVWIVTRGLAF